ncbi:hypothetical protein ACUTJJ_23335 [Agrobacterium sp. DKPNP3]|uniref:hypothetical protein n=1 Tax=Agrobacterium sp. DKPNP3 TaxID=3457323 RepID=UPI004043D75D
MGKRLERLSDQDFFTLLAKADDFAIVIKSAIIIEAEIEELFAAALPNPRHLFGLRLTYEFKVTLAVAVGLDERFLPVLKALASIRNDFAHKLNVGFELDDRARNLYATFHKYDRKLVRENYEALSEGRGTAFDDLTASDLFIMSVITLRAAIIAATRKAKSPGQTSSSAILPNALKN